MIANAKSLLMGIALLSMSVYAAPPKIVKICPGNGLTDVRPGETRIQIAFDQDMDCTYSFCGSGDLFPKSIERPQWVDKRTFVYTSLLEPSHVYTFGINSRRHKGFHSVAGEPVVPYVVKFRTRGEKGNVSASGSQAREANRQAVEALREAIDKHYSYKELRDVDWDALFDRNADVLLAADNPMAFARAAGLMLATTEDKHIWLKVGIQHVPAYVHPTAPNANPGLLKKLVPNFAIRNGNIATGAFPDGIGYIYIEKWSLEQREDYNALYEALDEFSDAPGLIIDVRCNGGGSETLAREFAGCLVDSSKTYAMHVVRDPQAATGFSPVRKRILRPNKERHHYHGKIAVLAGPGVVSSCEAFVLMMKQVPGCAIVGEPTQGSSGNPQPYDLGNGVTAYLPVWKALLPDGTCFEGKGIRPDILVEVEPNEITATEDPVIEAALKELRRNPATVMGEGD